MSVFRRCFILWLGLFCVLPGFFARAHEALEFTFRDPRMVQYRIEVPEARKAGIHAQTSAPVEWLKAWPSNGSTNFFEVNHRMVLQLKTGAQVAQVLAGKPLRVARVVADQVFILQAADAWAAVQEAQKLALHPEVLASVPVTRRRKQLQSRYARYPTDPYFSHQWNLENRTAMGAQAGADLNARAAWPYSRGEGVLIAFGDDGIELSHPEFVVPAAGAPHRNFATHSTNGMPSGFFSIHGTAVAGLAVASGNNDIGISGVAPSARVASWVIFDANDELVSDERLMDMFQFSSNIVSVQNHSWANADVSQFAPSLLEQIAISNAVYSGRGGRGVVMVRAAGNYRDVSGNANDDGYPSDPRVIAVGAVRNNGRVASYSNPGACLLVAAPSGDIDEGYPTLFTTDRQGTLGYNQISFTNDLADYCFDAYGFSGTSGSTPEIAGVAALILGANTNLHFRDVQQLLIFSARHFDLADPDIQTNGAGFRVSHNVGFGIPDAGQAVLLARRWTNRPAVTNLVYVRSNSVAIPNDGLRVVAGGISIPAFGSLGLHPDRPTPTLPLIDVGLATNRLEINLTNRAALIRRGTNFFRDKIEFAAQAGAAFAVVFNHEEGNERLIMGETEFLPIPAVFIGQEDGDRLLEHVRTNETPVTARLELNSAQYTFPVPHTLLCEHVSVHLQTDHPARGDLRITLQSPQGTRSVLQRVNSDTNSTLSDWVYHSVQHFYESSAGTWILTITDENPNPTGAAKYAALHIAGVPIIDSDQDGLDDPWEMRTLGSLNSGPQDDNDGDGVWNAREQILGSDPAVNEIEFSVDLSVWNDRLARLSWPGTTNATYEVFASVDCNSPGSLLGVVPGQFPETEWFTERTNLVHRFFRIRRQAP